MPIIRKKNPSTVNAIKYITLYSALALVRVIVPMKRAIERDVEYRDRVDVNKQWVEWKKTTVLQLVVIFCGENLQIYVTKSKCI